MSVQRTFRRGKSWRLKRFHMFHEEAVDQFLLQNKRMLLEKHNYNLLGFGHLHQSNKGINHQSKRQLSSEPDQSSAEKSNIEVGNRFNPLVLPCCHLEQEGRLIISKP